MTWEEARTYLNPAIEMTGGAQTEADVKSGVESGKYMLWTCEGGAALTEIVVFDRIKALSVGLAGGKKSAVKSLLPQIEKFAKDAGCDRLMFVGREGWRKEYPDFKFGYTMIYKDL